jgi:two-component sensor histidine kinase
MTLLAVTLAAVRLVGALVFIDFAFRPHKRLRYPVLAAGWLLYGASPLLRLASAAPTDLFGLLYGLTATLGILIITLGAISYLHSYPVRPLLYSALFIVLGSLLIWISSRPGLLTLFFPLLQFITVIGVFSRIVTRFQAYSSIGGHSYYWAAAILAAGALHALAYLAVYENYPEIPLPYAVTMVISVMLIIFFIHLEHTLSLREKDNLLSEVHHRVRNNLQLIESLLGLEQEYRNPEEYQILLNDVYKKIHSLALIHELVYEEGSYVSFDFSRYALRLAEEVNGTANYGWPVHCRVAAMPLYLKMEQVIPLAMVLQEALDNAAAHGCTEHSGGDGVEITVTVEQRGRNEGSLRVTDNGPGFPAGFDPGKGATLGFVLITQLVRQIDGTLTVDCDGGARLQVDFQL